MTNGEGGHEEELIGARPKADVQLALVQRQELALGSLTRLDSKMRRTEETKRDTMSICFLHAGKHLLYLNLITISASFCTES